jgi:anti-sigma regulatory factor (Ser/Thr protein kinase)
MTHKGFGLANIAKEMNRKVREWLPVGRFIATTLIEVDPHERMVSVWNGGNPPAILLAGDGTELTRFASRHLPLGIMRSSAMDLTFDRVSLECDAQLIVCSDGVIEAVDPNGLQFGVESIVKSTASTPRASRMRALNRALDEHLAGRRPHDDLSLAIIDCRAGLGENEDTGDSESGVSSRVMRQWRFDIELSPRELRQTDVVPMLVATLERMSVPATHRSRLFVVLSELFNNALDHGVLRLDSHLKTSEGMERYLTLRAKRLAALAEGWVCVGLRMTDRAGEQCLRIHVHDSGAGFDWRRQAGAGRNADPHGRGLALLHRLCKSIRYRVTGSEVVAVYSLAARSA